MSALRVKSGSLGKRAWTSSVAPRSASLSLPRRARASRFATDRKIRACDFQAESPKYQTVPLPDGKTKDRSLWRHYETILCLAGTLSNDEKDRELARLESFLLNEGAQDVVVTVRGPFKLAYPIKKNEQGIYALYRYVAKRQVSKDVEYLLSHPDVGTEDFILRYKTFAV